MEILMLRADVQEDKEVTMARFLNDPWLKIAEKVELEHYLELHELVAKVENVEHCLKGRGNTQTSYSYSAPNSRQLAPRSERRSAERGNFNRAKPDFSTKAKTEPPKVDNKGRMVTNQVKTEGRDVQYFKCQGRSHIAKHCPNQ